jgi:hypothetical protein
MSTELFRPPQPDLIEQRLGDHHHELADAASVGVVDGVVCCHTPILGAIVVYVGVVAGDGVVVDDDDDVGVELDLERQLLGVDVEQAVVSQALDTHTASAAVVGSKPDVVVHHIAVRCFV